jgi:hypothetical protein
MQISVPIENSVPIRRTPGSEVNLANQTATDVFIDDQQQRLDAAPVGLLTVTHGLKIAANTGTLRIQTWPASGVMWVRSNVATFIDVQP